MNLVSNILMLIADIWTKSNAIKPKICSVTHYVHDKYDDLFRRMQHASNSSSKVASSLASS